MGREEGRGRNSHRSLSLFLGLSKAEKPPLIGDDDEDSEYRIARHPRGRSHHELHYQHLLQRLSQIHTCTSLTFLKMYPDGGCRGLSAESRIPCRKWRTTKTSDEFYDRRLNRFFVPALFPSYLLPSPLSVSLMNVSEREPIPPNDANETTNECTTFRARSLRQKIPSRLIKHLDSNTVQIPITL